MRRIVIAGLMVHGAWLAPASAQQAERAVPYRAHASVEQYLDIYSPPAATRAPVALFIHGGSLEESGERRDAPVYAPVCPGLAARGVLCATMDYRLSPSYQWPAMPQDVAAAVRWLRDSIATRGGDPSHIVLVGHSSGCLLAAAVGLDSLYLHEQGLGLNALAGVAALGCTLAPWDTTGRGAMTSRLEQAFAADKQERAVFGSFAWRLRANPSLWASDRAPPMLVVVAEAERFFPSVLEQGARLVRLLREHDRPADIVIIPGRRHMTTTTEFRDPDDVVGDLIARFVRDPTGTVNTP